MNVDFSSTFQLPSRLVKKKSVTQVLVPSSKTTDIKKSDVTNYRGVCVSPNFAKVFEINILEQLRYNIFPNLSPSHHGFFPGRRVESNLMELSVLVDDSFSENCQTDIFYADIRKAFDVIRNIRLVFKLSH